MWKVGQKYTHFQMSAILKFDFQKKEKKKKKNNYVFLK